jgi:beta-lactamase class A
MRARVAIGLGLALFLAALALFVTPSTRSQAVSAQRLTATHSAVGRVDGHLTARPMAALRAALDKALSARTQVPFAVAVVDHRTGVTYSFQGGRRFETASVVKVDIIATLLLRNGGALSAGERSLAEAMIRNSDNDAASALWDTVGRATGVAAANRRFGLTQTSPDPDGYWGLTTTTVTDQVRLLDAITDPRGPLTDGSSALILDLMRHVSSGQDWGVSAAARSGETVALKNGWLAFDGGWIANSIGRITGDGTDLTIAILSKGHSSYTTGVAFVKDVAHLVRATLEL